MAKSKVTMGERLSEEQVSGFIESPYYEPGKAYQFVLTQGWVCVAYFLRMESPVEIRVAHANYYRNAGGQTHAAIAQSGGNAQTTWEYWGEAIINKMQILVAPRYLGKVPHGRIS